MRSVCKPLGLGASTPAMNRATRKTAVLGSRSSVAVLGSRSSVAWPRYARHEACVESGSWCPGLPPPEPRLPAVRVGSASSPALRRSACEPPTVPSPNILTSRIKSS